MMRGPMNLRTFPKYPQVCISKPFSKIALRSFIATSLDGALVSLNSTIFHIEGHMWVASSGRGWVPKNRNTSDGLVQQRSRR